LSRITATMATICTIVLILPHQLAAITMPSEAASTLNPVMMNSLLMIIMATTEDILPISTKITRAAVTRILSASGSINFPKLVTSFLFRAIYPSTVSVLAATIKIKAARKLLYGKSESSNAMKTGTNSILTIVILFARFIILPQ